MKARDLYVGFAFAWADVLLHVDADLVIRNAMGAVRSLTGETAEALVGRPLAQLFDPREADALARLGGLMPGSRLTLDRLALAGQGASPLALSAIRMEAGTGAWCLALRALAPASGELQSRQRLTERAGEFARAAVRRVLGDEQAHLGVVALDGLEGMKTRLSPADADQLGDVLRARIDALIGAEDSCAALDDGRFAYVDPAGRDGADVEGALEHTTRELDPEGLGGSAHVGTVAAAELAGVDEGDFVNGLVCSLSRFCQANERGLSVAELTRNFSQIVAEGVANVHSFGQLIRGNAFTVSFQPIVEARSGEIHHYEALCRFDPGESPQERLLFAEQAGMIHQFDLAMVAKVLAWLGKQPRNRASARVAVNVSGHSLEHPDFLTALEKLLDAYPWVGERLSFEITETARVTDLKASDRLIQRLRRRGHPVCVDDFGAGAASFQYLAELEVDVVKLDGAALEAALRGQRGQAFLAGLTAFCRRLGVRTVAEMVESEDHLQIARQCGADYLQGYLFGKPSPQVADFKPLPNAKLFANHPARPRVSAST